MVGKVEKKRARWLGNELETVSNKMIEVGIIERELGSEKVCEVWVMCEGNECLLG